jgi:hypothetical protein
MIEWFLEQTWLIEGLVSIVAGVVVVTIIYFWVEHIRGE